MSQKEEIEKKAREICGSFAESMKTQCRMAEETGSLLMDMDMRIRSIEEKEGDSIRLRKLKMRREKLKDVKAVNMESTRYISFLESEEFFTLVFKTLKSYADFRRLRIEKSRREEYVRKFLGSIEPEDYDYHPFEDIRYSDPCRKEEDGKVFYDFSLFPDEAVWKKFLVFFSRRLETLSGIVYERFSGKDSKSGKDSFIKGAVELLRCFGIEIDRETD